MRFLDGLNAPQREAVTAGLGAVLVLAGPGAGKTRVLTHRIAYLAGVMGVRPFNILAVTFTNKAAREMENRVSDLLGGRTRGLTLGTFHAACARILRREAAHLPFESSYVIYDADDQVGVVKRALKDLDLDEKHYRPQGVHAAISRAKNELIFPDEFPIQTYRDEVVARVYRRYQEMLLASNALDFDDLLLWTVHLLEEQPEVRERYALRYEHVLVDEFQDTNVAQYALLKLLASRYGNIFVVGDVDQSIYRWRGADYRNVLRFERDFPDARVILLEQNYRSTQLILDAAMAVINRNKQRTPKRLFTERGQGRAIIFQECFDDREAAAYVVDTLAALVATGEADPGDMALMYRTNAQSRLLEEAFLRASLPYKLVGAQRFYGRREIKDVIGFLRLVHNLTDEVSLLRVINVPPRRIGNKTLLALRTRALQVGVSPGELLAELGRGQTSPHWDAFPRAAAQSLGAFGAMLNHWREIASELSPLQLMDQILGDVDYQRYLDDRTDVEQSRWENVQELRRLAADYSERGLTDFLEEVALVSDQDTLEEKANVPTLLTLHAAKGLEFPIVFIVGLDDGTLPHIRSFDDPEAMEEERRLFYVGITRTQNRLYLVHALNRSAYGYLEPTELSRFMEDIPAEVLAGDHPSPLRGQGLAAQRATRWQSANQAAPVLQPRYHAGTRVQHPTWGEGMVLKTRLEADEEIVDIFFESVGLKRVAASLARLEIRAG